MQSPWSHALGAAVLHRPVVGGLQAATLGAASPMEVTEKQVMSAAPHAGAPHGATVAQVVSVQDPQLATMAALPKLLVEDAGLSGSVAMRMRLTA